jgi:hypothetical protein
MLLNALLEVASDANADDFSLACHDVQIVIIGHGGRVEQLRHGSMCRLSQVLPEDRLDKCGSGAPVYCISRFEPT